jgi:chemotaxis regulatin CheY-phosphate phosphatase CheZ
MSGQPLPEIRLELNSGTFKIRTPAAIYVITVQPVSTVAQEISQVVEQEVASDMVAEGTETSKDSNTTISMAMDDVFYRDVSMSMLSRVGALAKKLNVSLKDLSTEVTQGIDFGKSGRRLSDAMEQLEEINIMTENAAMVIMDLTEKIQEDIGWTKENIKVLNEIDLASDESVDSAYREAEKMCSVVETHRPLVDEIVSGQQELLASISKLSELEGETGNKEDAEKFYEFDLDAIFQTLYEFCTNEAVKKHLKTMREDKQACDPQRFNTAINESLKEIKFENNLVDIPIKSILAAFFQATDSEKYKGFLEKLDANLSSLFLEAHLPVELPNPKGGSKTGSEDPTILAILSDIAGRANINLEKMLKVKTEFFDSEIDSSIFKNLGDKTVIKREDRDTIKKILGESNLRFSSIMDLGTKIFENLSFQDLAGQKIRKIIKLLTEFQAQLLIMLVGFDAQIKTREHNKDITAAESEKLVQREVDKVLASVMVGTEGEAMEKRFDQDAVNEILESMGF